MFRAAILPRLTGVQASLSRTSSNRVPDRSFNNQFKTQRDKAPTKSKPVSKICNRWTDYGWADKDNH